MEALIAILTLIAFLLILRSIRGKEHPELVGRSTDISRENLQKLFGKFTGPPSS